MLVELIYHTTPTFRHVLAISEGALETVNQTLEQSMARNPHEKKQ